MMDKVLYNRTTRQVLARELKVAHHFLERLKGLMFTKKFPECGGLIIEPCGGVHTFFMRYPLDIILIDAQNVVLYKKIAILPNRLTPYFKCSRIAVELPAGTLLQQSVSLGDELQILFKE